eukprot:349759-Chlamydomonas_euryale.AAC.6
MQTRGGRPAGGARYLPPRALSLGRQRRKAKCTEVCGSAPQLLSATKGRRVRLPRAQGRGSMPCSRGHGSSTACAWTQAACV